MHFAVQLFFSLLVYKATLSPENQHCVYSSGTLSLSLSALNYLEISNSTNELNNCSILSLLECVDVKTTLRAAFTIRSFYTYSCWQRHFIYIACFVLNAGRIFSVWTRSNCMYLLHGRLVPRYCMDLLIGHKVLEDDLKITFNKRFAIMSDLNSYCPRREKILMYLS